MYNQQRFVNKIIYRDVNRLMGLGLGYMARIKTSSFYISTEVTDILATATSSTLDISQYVDAPSGQAILVEEVQFCWFFENVFRNSLFLLRTL